MEAAVDAVGDDDRGGVGGPGVGDDDRERVAAGAGVDARVSDVLDDGQGHVAGDRDRVAAVERVAVGRRVGGVADAGRRGDRGGTLFPYATLFRSAVGERGVGAVDRLAGRGRA